MPRITEQAKQERIQGILDGARRCFARHGYEGATVARLEQEIGLSRGAIFNWFPSKEELFVALAAIDNARLMMLFADEGFDALVRQVSVEDPDWLFVYLEFGRRFRADEAFRQRWKELAPPDVRERTKQRLEAEQASGRLRSDLTAEQIGQFLGLVLDGIVVQRGFGFDGPAPETIVRLVDDALTPVPGPSRRRRPRAQRR
jgi:AcrR family transcriptional regulator